MLSVELIDSLFYRRPAVPVALGVEVPGADAARRGRGSPGFAPSPTGWLHIGGIFTASVNLDLAMHSGGRYLPAHRGHRPGAVSPRTRSRSSRPGSSTSASRRTSRTRPAAPTAPTPSRPRAEIYQTYVRELMRRGMAYPCFETPEQAEKRASRGRRTVGRAPRFTTGEWAIWRDAPEDQVRARLDAGDPYVRPLPVTPASAASGSASPT